MSNFENRDGWVVQESRQICRAVTEARYVKRTDGTGHGTRISFVSKSGNLVNYVLTDEAALELDSQRAAAWGELQGLGFGVKDRARAKEYLRQITPSDTEYWLECDKAGWFNDSSFAVPGTVLPAGTKAFYGNSDEVQLAGTLESWRLNVSMPCTGQPRLMTALCTAFAGPLLKLAGASSFAVNYYGQSSIGKTTALNCAASVWGEPVDGKQRHRANATLNSLEALAERHNDMLFALDDLKQFSPEGAVMLSYLLGNGQGKNRLTKEGQQQKTRTWRVVTLCTSEQPYADMVVDSGKSVSGGSEVRMLDIPADAGAAQGILSDAQNADALINSLAEGSTQNYGVAGREYATKLIQDADKSKKILKLTEAFVSFALPRNSAPQVRRVAHNFALLAAAGELATEYEITGWEPGEATQAVSVCFQSWLTARGNARFSHEENGWLEAVKALIEDSGEQGRVRVADWRVREALRLSQLRTTAPAIAFLIAQGILLSEGNSVRRGSNGNWFCVINADRLNELQAPLAVAA